MYFQPDMIPVYIISGVFMIAGMILSQVLQSRMKKYSQIPTRGGMTGADVARRMLSDHGINDVKVVSVEGFLSDHYNPVNKTVNLSPMVYESNSVAAASVAAHEVGHAVQHATGYAWIRMRSALVPVVQFSGWIVQLVIIAGVLLINTFPQLLLAGIILFAITTAFSLITLPVEFDASRRGLAWIENRNIVSGQEYAMAKDGLKWAASTYVIAALQSVATLVYYIFLYTSGVRRDDD